MAGLIGFFGSRLMAWVFLGGGALFVAVSVYKGIQSRGAAKADAAWQRVIGDKQKVDRASNQGVNMRSVDENATLQEQERQIREKWLTSGRGAPVAPAKPKE